MSEQEIKLIAEGLDELGPVSISPAAEVPDLPAPPLDDVGGGMPDPGEIAGSLDDDGYAPSEINDGPVVIDQDLLLAVLELVKENGSSCGDPGDDTADVPEEFESPDLPGESESDESESDESESDESESDESESDESESDESESEESESDESEEVEVDESTSKDKKPINEEDEEDEETETDEPDSGPEESESEESEEAESDDSEEAESDDSEAESDESGASDVPEFGAADDTSVPDLPEEDAGSNMAALVDKLVQLSASGTLSMVDLPEIKQCCFPDAIDVCPECGQEVPEDEMGGEEMGGEELDGEVPEEMGDDVPEGGEVPDELGDEGPEGVAGDEEDSENPFESMKPVEEIAEAKGKKPWEDDEGEDDDDEEDDEEGDVSEDLATDVAAFAESLGDVVIRKSKSENGVEYLGDDDTFTKVLEAINKELPLIKEGKSKASVGSMSKYSRCFPVHGGGRLYYVFK